MTRIEHKDDGASLILKLEYTYARDGLITQVDETDATGWLATVAYTYDNRNKLIEEERTARSGQPTYHFSYTYDQGGNRLMKTDFENITFTQYHYDLEDISTYHTWNNRLMYYEVFDNSSAMEPSLLERMDYEYEPFRGGEFGNPTRLVHSTYESGEPVSYDALTLQYTKQNELWFASRQHWTPDDCESFVVDEVLEVGGIGRSRHLIRQRDPADTTWPLENDAAKRSDYDGDVIYDDYAIQTNEEEVTTITPMVAYLPGVGQMTLDPETGEPTAVTYFHGDHLGTLRALTESDGDVIGRLVYTAFGEKINETGTIGTRYAYAASSGYETLDELSFLHVGHRYYDPSTGRFLQRDPIGIAGGMNVYAYVGNLPSSRLDPLGLEFITGRSLSGAAGGAAGFFAVAALCTGPIGLGVGALIAGTSALGYDIGVATYDDAGSAWGNAMYGWYLLGERIYGVWEWATDTGSYDPRLHISRPPGFYNH